MEETSVEKVEEVPIYEKVTYEKGEIVFMPQFDIGRNFYGITKWEVVEFDNVNFILSLKGLMDVKDTVKPGMIFRVNVLDTVVFKDFNKAKHNLENNLMKFYFKICKALKNLDSFEEPGVLNEQGNSGV